MKMFSGDNSVDTRRGQGQAAMHWAERMVSTGLGGLNDRLHRLKTLTSAISASVAAKINLDTRTTAHHIVQQQLDDVEKQIAAAPSVNSATAVQLLESLEKAKAYVEAEQTMYKCPTCLRPIGRDALLATINTEFAQLSDLKKLIDSRQQILGSVNVASSCLDEAKAGVIEALKEARDVIHAGDIPEVTCLNISWPNWQNAVQDMPSLVAIYDQLQAIQASLEKQHDNAHRDVNQFNSIKEWWSGIKEAKDKATDLYRIRKGLKQALDIVHDKRVAFTQGILDGIQLEANRLFQAIHPGENIGLEQLKMEEERHRSVSQIGVFHGHKGIPPQAIFSESHLDTLGFCVRLALAKRETPDKSILLIDDIFSSVDATHLGRVIELLSAEAPNFSQVIVSTHYRLWWDRCQNAEGIQRVHLGRWCATNGIAAQNMPRVLDELRAKISEAILDRQAVASRAGILLESVLNDLTLLYECSLPHNKLNQYTLGTLLNGCTKLFSKYNLTVQINANWNVDGQPESWQATVAKAAYYKVNGLEFIRNQIGCHFNISGMEIPDGDVRDFGTATIALVESLTCPNCGSLATKTANDGTHLRYSCAKKAARMTPVAIT